MKKKTRAIVVRNQTYYWRFVPYMRHLPCFTSRMLIYNEEKSTCIEVFFQTHDTWTGGNPVNEGLPMIKNGRRTALNFHKPQFVAELLERILDSYDAAQLKRLIIGDGNPLIAQMGYREPHEEYRDPSFRFLK